LLLDTGRGDLVKPLLAALMMVLWACAAHAVELPRPPCGGTISYPAFAAAGAPPNVAVWSSGDPGANWTPPACTGWAPATGVVVGLAARFQFAGSTEALLARFGAISTLRGIRYWSVTDRAWLTLITEATALDSPDLTQARTDFTAGELAPGHDLYFAHDDNRVSGEIVYRLSVRERTPSRLVVATENVSPMRKLLLTLVDPGGLQSIQFLDRETPTLWRYYALARTEADFTSVFGVAQGSYVNRAAAFYRHLTGVPTDRDPPLAP
jgi:hypothetical protein